MSFIVYDRLSVSVARSNYEWSFYRRFDKFWEKSGNKYNTKMVIYDGDPVYTEDDKVFMDFINSLGIKYDDILGEDVLDEYDDAEVEDYWFELEEPHVQTEEDPYLVEDALSHIQTFVPGQYFEVKFYYGQNFLLPGDKSETINVDNSDLANPQYNKSYAMDPVEVRDAVMQSPGEFLIGTKSVRSSNSRGDIIIIDNKPFHENYYMPDSLTTISDKMNYPFKPCIQCSFLYPKYYFYALFDYGFENFELVSMSDPVVISTEPTNHMIEWTVRYKVKSDLIETSACLVFFIEQFNRFWYTNRSTAPEPIRITQKDYEIDFPLSAYPDSWEDGQLLVDKSFEMKKGDFTNMIATAFTSDYDIEEPEWWEKLLGVVIAIAGVVVGVVLCCTGTGSTIISIGTSLMAASATWAIGALALGAIGGASTFGIIKNIAGMIQFASITAGVLSFYQFINVGLKNIFSSIQRKFTSMTHYFSGNNVGVIDSVNVITDITNTSQSLIDESVEYAFENNIDLKDIFPNIDLTNHKIVEAVAKYSMKKKEDRMLVKSFVELSSAIYNNYSKNINQEYRQEIYDEIEEFRRLNEENAPGNYSKVLGDAIFSYSLGSYDAIAMLDLKVESKIGHPKGMDDPSLSIT